MHGLIFANSGKEINNNFGKKILSELPVITGGGFFFNHIYLIYQICQGKGRA